MIILILLLIFVAWCFIGDVICYFHTKWSMKEIYEQMNYTPESFNHEVNRDIFMERNYVPDDVTMFDICCNTILWPRTLIRSHRGHIKFVTKHKEDTTHDN